MQDRRWFLKSCPEEFFHTRRNVSVKISYILNLKIGSAYNIILLGWWSLESGIYDISGTKIKTIQISVGKRDLYAISWYDTCVHRTNEVRSFVSIKCTHLAFLVKPIFKSQTKFSVTFIHTGGVNWHSTNISKVMPILIIYFSSASRQRVLVFSVLSLFLWSMFVGISIPYLWVVLRIRDFTSDNMKYCFHRVYGNHHVKVGSLEISHALEN